MQNIGAGNADDAFYRYKMPKLVAKIEGRGNGIKTNIVNNVEVAKALDRPPEYALKYFGCDLGAQTKFDKATGTSIVNGAHDAGKLSELLEGFIKKYVQCYSCGNPETQIKIRKESIFLKCKACGYVSDVDMRHKLNNFIINNPPENKLSKEEKKLKKAEEERMREATEAERRERKEKKKEKKEKDGDGEKKKKKDKKKKKEDGEGSDDKKNSSDDEEEDDDDDGVVWMTDTSAEAAKQRAAEQLTEATAAMVTQGNIEAEQAAAKKKAEKEAAAAAAAEEEAARLVEEEEAKLAEEVAKKLAIESEAADANVVEIRSLIEGGDAGAIASAVKALSVPGGLAGKMSVLYQALFAHLDASIKLADEVKAQKKILSPHSKDQPGQLAQLIALEHLLAVACSDRVKEGALVLKTMYDLDLADDEVIIAWSEKADAGKILSVPADDGAAMRKVVAPLVEWLNEESDDEESDE